MAPVIVRTVRRPRLAGLPAALELVPGAGSEQLGVRIHVVGDVRGAERLVVRGSIARLSFAAFAVRDDRIRGGFVMGRTRDLPGVRALVRSATRADDARLVDEASPLPH